MFIYIRSMARFVVCVRPGKHTEKQIKIKRKDATATTTRQKKKKKERHSLLPFG